MFIKLLYISNPITSDIMTIFTINGKYGSIANNYPDIKDPTAIPSDPIPVAIPSILP